MNEEEERKGSRRKTKTPVKMNIKTREERSPSRKKVREGEMKRGGGGVLPEES